MKKNFSFMFRSELRYPQSSDRKLHLATPVETMKEGNQRDQGLLGGTEKREGEGEGERRRRKRRRRRKEEGEGEGKGKEEKEEEEREGEETGLFCSHILPRFNPLFDG